VEQPQIELIVRLTARMSAAAFATALLLLSFSTAHHQRRSRHGIHFLWAFIVVHTIHFGAVLWLAAVTNGANIEDRGGWPLMVAVAMIFYGSSFAILRLWRGVNSRQGEAPGERFAAHAGVAVIALVFLNSYLARVETLPVYWLPAIGMVAVVATYFVRAREAIAAHERSSATMPARTDH
jgi:hypothetical protein